MLTTSNAMAARAVRRMCDSCIGTSLRWWRLPTAPDWNGCGRKTLSAECFLRVVDGGFLLFDFGLPDSGRDLAEHRALCELRVTLQRGPEVVFSAGLRGDDHVFAVK